MFFLWANRPGLIIMLYSKKLTGLGVICIFSTLILFSSNLAKRYVTSLSMVTRVCFFRQGPVGFSSPCSPITPLTLFIRDLTCIKSLLSWPWNWCYIAIDTLSLEGSVAECCPRLLLLVCRVAKQSYLRQFIQAMLPFTWWESKDPLIVLILVPQINLN